MLKIRTPPEGLSTRNLWGRFHATQPGRDLDAAIRIAIDRCARRMLGASDEAGPSGSEFPGRSVTGVAGIRALAQDLPSWAEREDARWLASYNARAIEKFGNGGGNFRRLYAGFLAWARERDAALVPATAAADATRAADAWTALSETLGAASQEGSDPALFTRAAEQALAIAEREHALFEALAHQVAE